MTTLAILGGDWLLSFDDENDGGNAVAGLRKLEYVTGIVRTTNEVYSDVAANADFFQAMAFENPMLPTTPNAYTMENQYFIPRSSTEFLKEGAVTSDYTTQTGVGNGVIRKEYAVGGGSNFVTADIGKQVLESASGPDSGTLLDFDVDPDGTLIAWIRPDDGATDVFDATSGTISVTADGGTGTVDVTVVGTTGVTVYSAIQAIGSVPTATEVYLVQDRIKMTDSTGTFQWWTTDSTVSLGIISILIRIQDMGVLVAEGDVEVFARRYTSLYDNFRLNVAAGGFQALPLASAADINNTTGYFDGAWDAGTGSAMLVGDVISNTFTGKVEGKYVVTAVSDSGATGTFTWYEVGDLTPFADNDTFTSSNRNGTIQGSPTAAVGGPTEAGAGNGLTVTLTLGATEVDHTGDAVVEPYSVEVDSQTDVPIATVYEVLKYRTKRGIDATGLFGAGINLPGETYRGLDGVYEVDSVAAFTEGDDIDIVAKADYSSRAMANHDTRSPPHITLTDQQTSLQTVVDNDALRDEGTDTVVIEDGAGATLFFAGSGGGIQTFTSPKSSPLGTFTGTQIFGARGVVFINPLPADAQAYILTDDLGTLNNPPNTVAFTVNNTLAEDRVLVARDTGTPGVINKDQFGGMTAVAASSKTITVAGSVDSEVPTVGFLRVVENVLQEEHKYYYTSRTTGAGGVFTLTDITASTATAGTSPTILEDTTADFITEGVRIGMLVQDTTNGDTYEVVSITDLDTLVIRQVFGTGGTFASTDSYNINETIQLYATGDDLYDLILDIEALSGTESNTFVKTLAADFDVVVNVRQGKIILPFTQNQTVGDAGASVTVVRTPDTIAV